ncbi:MAG: cation transporter [Planctomycetota bacterium]|nr:MAG: cation transporter [Planctomycetota bacterium]
MTTSELQRNTIIGFMASIALSILKLFAGIWGRSSALIADATESLADTAGSILVWQALRVSARPPDQDHPYGYGKAEALASLGVGLMLIGAALFIASKALHEIVVPHEPPAAWTLLVLLAVIAVKELLFRFVMRGASEFDSAAARADAWHHRSDAITSLAALGGVSLAVWGPRWFHVPSLVFADEVAAILASGIILVTAWTLIRPAIRELLDAVTPEMAERVATIARRVEGVRDVEKVFVRKSGPGYHVDMHLHVDPDLTIRVAHALAGHVKAILKEELPSLTGVLIHVEPAESRREPIV